MVALCRHGTKDDEGWCAQCEAFGPDTLEQIIARVPDGYGWLLRSNHDGRFFAHVSRRGYLPMIDATPPAGSTFKVWAMTPEAALDGAVLACGQSSKAMFV